MNRSKAHRRPCQQNEKSEIVHKMRNDDRPDGRLLEDGPPGDDAGRGPGLGCGREESALGLGDERVGGRRAADSLVFFFKHRQI